MVGRHITWIRCGIQIYKHSGDAANGGHKVTSQDIPRDLLKMFEDKLTMSEGNAFHSETVSGNDEYLSHVCH